MAKLSAQFQKDFSGGMVTNVNENLAPNNTVKLALNGVFDEEIGSFVSRLGSGLVGSIDSDLSSNRQILGLHQFTDPVTPANDVLFAATFFYTAGTFTAAVTDVITSPGHGLINGDRVIISSTGTLPAGLTAGGKYVIDATTDTFKLSEFFGGVAINITDTGSGVHSWGLNKARIYDVKNGTPVAGGFTVNRKVRFLSFLGAVLVANGVDVYRSYTPSGGWILTGGAFDLANMPIATPSHIVEWLDRVYLIGDTTNPDRLYYSGPASDGAISWTVSNGWVDIEPEDGGGGLTALGKVPGFLLIFKERSLKRWNFDSAFPETLINIGTPSHDSVVSAAGICAFFSASSDDTHGFYITNGGDPVLISHDRPKGIKKWVDAIPQSYFKDVSGFGTRRYFMWSIGDVTVDGVDYTNVVVRWNKLLDQWSVFSFPTEFRVFSTFVEDGENKVIAGDDDGNVIELNKVDTFTDYDGSPIRYRVDLHDEKFGYNQKKEMSEELIVESIGMEGARVTLSDDNGNKFISKTITDRVTECKLDDSVKANVFKTSIEGVVNGERAVLKEIEYPNINVIKNYGS